MPDTSTATVTRTTLRLDPLLHPSDFSRMLLALSATAITIGAYVAFLVVIAGPLGLAIVSFVLLVLVGTVWLGLQLYRARLLGMSVRVSEDSLPEIQSLIEDIRDLLGYHRPVDVYITQKVNPSVTLTSYFGTKIIVLEGSLIGDLIDGEDRAQLTFLVARAFGALKARHTRFAFAVVLLDGLRLVPYTAPFLLPYFRASTYSGDQIGLACCDSLNSALTATERLLVGKEVEPSLRARGVIAQAEHVCRRWLPRLVQLLLPEPHLTNRYVNLLHFCRRHDPAAYEAFRSAMDESTLARVDALKQRSAYRREPSSHGRKSVLTAIAVGATVAFLGVATAGALSLRPDAATSATSSSFADTDTPPPTPEPDFEPSSSGSSEVELLSHVPASLRGSCETNSDTAATDSIAALRCPGSESSVYYNLFASKAALNADFRTSRSLHGGSTDDDCKSGSADGTWSLDGETAGRLLCYQDEGSSWIVWTHDELLIQSDMLRLDKDSKALFADWKLAGPD